MEYENPLAGRRFWNGGESTLPTSFFHYSPAAAFTPVVSLEIETRSLL
jgi:hypothetical protein